MNDAELLSAVLVRRQARWAIAIVLGTGSILLGLEVRQGSSHCFAKLGGHGHLFGDPGSGYHLGLTAIAAAADAHGLGAEVEGGLAEALRDAFEVKDTAEVPARAVSFSHGTSSIQHDLDITLDAVTASNKRKLRIAALSPTVLALSSQCPVAASALALATDRVASDVLRIHIHAKKIGMPDGGLIITGGLGNQELYRASLLAALRKVGLEFDWVETVSDPATTGAQALCHTV